MADSAKKVARKKRKEAAAAAAAAAASDSSAVAGVDTTEEKVTPEEKGEPPSPEDVSVVKKREKKKRRKLQKQLEQAASDAAALALVNTNKKDPLQFEIDKELAKTQTIIPKIGADIMALIKTDPAQAFIQFEAALLMTHEKLWFKCLVDHLEANTLLPEQIATIMSLHPGDQKAQYNSLKLLLFKTYTCVDAPSLARISFLAVRMNASLGPRALLTLMLSAWKITEQYAACDVNNITFLNSFAANLPQTVRMELFRNKTLTEVASDVCMYAIDDQSWIQPLADKAHLIWENMLSSGALKGTDADLSHIKVVNADADPAYMKGAAAAAGNGLDDGFKAKVLNYIGGNQNGGKRKRSGTKTTNPEFFFQGDLAAKIKDFESRYDAKDLEARKALILSGKRIVNTDGPDGSCTHDHLFDKDTFDIPNKRKNAKPGTTRTVRLCVKCGRLNHSASRCTDSGSKKGKGK